VNKTRSRATKIAITLGVLLGTGVIGVGVVVAFENTQVPEQSAAVTTAVVPATSDPTPSASSAPSPEPVTQPEPTDAPVVDPVVDPEPEPTSSQTPTPSSSPTAAPVVEPIAQPAAPITVVWDPLNMTARYLPGGDPSWNMQTFWLTDCDGANSEVDNQWAYNVAECPTYIALTRPDFWEPNGWWFEGDDNDVWFKNEQAYLIEIEECEFVNESTTISVCQTSKTVEPEDWNGEPIIKKQTPWQSTWIYDPQVHG
jgi:hypothetical protein